MGRIYLLVYFDSLHHLIITSANDCLDTELFILTQNLIVQGVTAHDRRAIPSKYLDLSWYLQSLHGSYFSHLSLHSDESWKYPVLSYSYSILSAITLSLHQWGIWRRTRGAPCSSDLSTLLSTPVSSSTGSKNPGIQCPTSLWEVFLQTANI